VNAFPEDGPLNRVPPDRAEQNEIHLRRTAVTHRIDLVRKVRHGCQFRRLLPMSQVQVLEHGRSQQIEFLQFHLSLLVLFTDAAANDHHARFAARDEFPADGTASDHSIFFASLAGC